MEATVATRTPNFSILTLTVRMSYFNTWMIDWPYQYKSLLPLVNVVCLIKLSTTGRSYFIPKSDNLKLVLSTNDFTAVVIYKKDCNHRIFFSVLYNIYINLHCINECCLRIDIEGKTDLFGRKLRFFVITVFSFIHLSWSYFYPLIR